MRIFQIKTNDELKIALARADQLWETGDAEELDEFDVLATLISDYEDKMLVEERKNQQEIKVKIDDL
jgi:antitoxin component HigA of HigAB toxin-antitoxin module